MALNDEQITRIDALFAERGADPAALGDLRQKFPGLSLTRCDLSDMGGEAPFRRYSQFSLFLVDRSEHCWRITRDPDCATGLVVAQHKAGA